MTPTPPDRSPMPPEDGLNRSARAIRYGLAIAVVIIGILCGAVIPGTTGGTICTAVVGIGLVGVVSLVFYDVGLTEDRDRDRMRRRLERMGESLPSSPNGSPSTARPHPPEGRERPPRPARLRGHRRRLR
ncbi:MAG TPA: hypothetical protein VG325_19605 [Solirubrobacteraceae bacterium]|nr:hypothetical protein [Solirubrobacteraceae bacterium]